MESNARTAAIMGLISPMTPQTKDELPVLLRAIFETVGGPTEEAIRFFHTHQGEACAIRDSTIMGVVYALNTSTSGFYPGKEYPIRVKVLNKAEGVHIFDYRIEDIMLIG